MAPDQLLAGVTFGCCSPETLGQLRTLNKAIFPINYSERMYQEILACGEVSQLAFHSGSLVGAIGCRLENTPEVGTAGQRTEQIKSLGWWQRMEQWDRLSC